MKSAIQIATENLKSLLADKQKREGERLRKKRLESGLSQTGLSRVVQFSQHYISGMESGKHPVPAEVWERLKEWNKNK